ncbi:flavin-containing monooxygenase [Streptomyces cacaoi]|uniref:Baeyer-Villiger monooxygenase n=1 Tax=Streptomyces cacaoi TaxID=1898 RepID=A0A4Y3QW43_STRCI|nr:NAD(P)/FAD-dependent oxidoreductase [Streptomyces cacaoi]NNG88901.1 NAD(P)/FAD-dependent oxidoreductase [Streptomyces cacaoi]GEB49442.1 Baeyer-Villiger monooxygenase [Streptomyces cacaoi]
MAAEHEQEHVRVAVIGSGFGGLGAAVRLRRAGETDFVVLERRDSVGGTWYDNTYPGCACDIPSHLYSFSFAPNAEWPRSFSPQPDIREYLERVADTFGLRQHIRLGTEVQQMSWDAEELCWRVETSAGPLTADVVVSATGPLSEPKLPDIPGLDGFGGKVFHSATWDHSYDLRGKRVAVIGTGASAIQIIPAVQPVVGELTVFQRTPAWVLPRRDRRITGLEKKLHARWPLTQKLRRLSLWGVRELETYVFANRPNLLPLVEKVSTLHMRRAVKDPQLRRKLTPDYRVGCKRTLLSDDYYPALAQPNTRVIDSGLAEIRGNTLVSADGREAEVDAIVFCSGFHVSDMPVAQLVKGADGRTMAQSWAEDGMNALRGTTTTGFPNFLFVIGPNTGLGTSSMILIIEAQLNYLVDYLHKLDTLGGGAGGRVALDVRPVAQHRYNARLRERIEGSVWETGCTSWYLDAQGRPVAVWPGTTGEFRKVTREVWLEEYEVLRAAAGPGRAAPRLAGSVSRGAATAAFHTAEDAR